MKVSGNNTVYEDTALDHSTVRGQEVSANTD